jgi:hypothetical protein
LEIMPQTCPQCRRPVPSAAEGAVFCSFCGTPLAPTQQASTGPFDAEAVTAPPVAAAVSTVSTFPQQIGAYRLLRRLGAGGMGTVFEAEQVDSGRRVAVKLVAPHCLETPEAVERFRREGRLAGTITHPRCVFVLTADEDAGRPYIVMELMPGSTLRDLLEEKGPLSVPDAVAKILDVIEGLQEAHKRGVIHRDVKRGNCFLDAEGRVKVGDFGLAKVVASEADLARSTVPSPVGAGQSADARTADTHLTRTGAFLGTLLFASPEQINAEPLTPQTDVYSVAATLYYLLTGRAPFQGGDAAATMARIVAESPPSMRILRPEIPASLDRLVLRGLERQRGRRWRDLGQLRTALLRYLPGQLSIVGMGSRLAAFAIDALGVGLLEQQTYPLLMALVLPLELSAEWQITISVLCHTRRQVRLAAIVTLHLRAGHFVEIATPGAATGADGSERHRHLATGRNRLSRRRLLANAINVGLGAQK